jgi:alanine racemase
LTDALAVLTIDLGALVANWQAVARLAAPARCGAVVKGDAYGLGATPVVRALLRAGCREFFVALVDEGVRLRESLGAAWPRDARLHVLHGPRQGDEDGYLAHGLVPVLNSMDQVERWQALARRKVQVLAAALHIDTAMARVGLPPPALRRRMETADGLAGIETTLVMSHLVRAEDPQDPVSRRQLELFRPWRDRFPAAWGCLAHSAGIFLGREFHFDLVRPGAALYGLAAAGGAAPPLRPVVRGLDAEDLRGNAYEVLTSLGGRHCRHYLGDIAI